MSSPVCWINEGLHVAEGVSAQGHQEATLR